jgi:sugar/nucleoside kinase (ribokinase family)
LSPPPPFLCAGAAHWDIIGRTRHALPWGADVPGRVTRQPGGVAQNIARALAALGHPAALVSAIGRDRAGEELAADLAAAGIDCTGLLRHDGPTDCYLGIEGPGGALHAAVADCQGLERAALSLLSPLRNGRLPSPWPGTLVLDGNLPSPVLAAFLLEPSRSMVVVPASPEKAGRLRPYLAGRPSTLYLNRLEAEALAGRAFPDRRAAAAALLATGAVEAIVTDGANPATAASAAETVTRDPPRVRQASTTGGGDVFVGTHLAARAGGLDADAALAAALDAATRHISRETA